MTKGILVQAKNSTTQAQKNMHMLIARYRLRHSVNTPETQLLFPVSECADKSPVFNCCVPCNLLTLISCTEVLACFITCCALLHVYSLHKRTLSDWRAAQLRIQSRVPAHFHSCLLYCRQAAVQTY